MKMEADKRQDVGTEGAAGAVVMSPADCARNKKRMRTKRLIGILLLLAIAYFVFTNFDIGLPWIGLVVEGSGETCTEMTGPDVMTDTVIEQLEIEDAGFTVMRNEDKAVITVKNIDDQEGDVRVRIFCIDGRQQGDQTRTLKPGSKAIFNFLDVPDCDLDYVVEPDTIKRTVNRTVQVSETKCE